MVYSTYQPRGITVEVKSYRKSKGGKRDGRSNCTGKKAKVKEPGKDPVIIHGGSFDDLNGKLREQFDIPTHITINKSGITEF